MAISHLLNNLPKVMTKLEKNHFHQEHFVHDEYHYVLYISAITPDIDNDGLIICIERKPSLLSEHELLSLENSLNLLMKVST